jgi:hypothetical protein
MIIFNYTKNIFNDRGLKKARIFFLRSLLCYPEVVIWLKYIDSFYKKYNFTSAPSELAGLPIRSYASNIFKIKQRNLISQDHYKIMESVFSPLAIKKFLSDSEISISSLLKKTAISAI